MNETLVDVTVIADFGKSVMHPVDYCLCEASKSEAGDKLFLIGVYVSPQFILIF